MDGISKDDMTRIGELLRKTGEFIAYFEFVDLKMVEWRQHMEKQMAAQQLHFSEQIHALTVTLTGLQNAIAQGQFTELYQATLLCSNACQDALKKVEEQLTHLQEAELSKLSNLIQETIMQTMTVEQSLPPMARETPHSTTSDDESTLGAQMKYPVRWGTILSVLFSTLLTAFILGLYMNDELPWEIHQHAREERNAGKMLLNVWPLLSEQEKNKIMGHQMKYKS